MPAEDKLEERVRQLAAEVARLKTLTYTLLGLVLLMGSAAGLQGVLLAAFLLAGIGFAVWLFH